MGGLVGEDETKGVRSLQRGLQMLEVFARPREERTVQELAVELGIPLPSAYRLVNTLVDMGYLERQRSRGPLRLGLSLIRLGALAHSGLDLREAARPVLEKLVATTGETAVVVLAAADRVVCIDNLEGTSPIRPASLKVGEDAPYTAGAIGQVVLAHLAAAHREEILRAGWTALTPSTLVTREAVEERCEQVHRDGYAYSIGETIAGTAAIAAPVFGAGGGLVGGLGITGIAERMEGLEDVVTAAASEVSAAMGYRAD